MADVGMLILSIAKFCWGIGLTLYVFFVNRRKAMLDQVTKVKRDTAERLERHADRITCLESDVKHLPSQENITKLSERIDTLNGSISTVSGRLEGINRAVDLINQFLINNGGKQ